MTKKRNRKPVAAQSSGTALATKNGNEAVAAISTNGLDADARQYAVLGEAISRLRFAQRFGWQYEGDRDIARVGGYPRDVRYEDMVGFYDRDPIAGRGVDMVAETTWRRPPEIVELDNDGNPVREPTEFMQAWSSMSKQLRIWNRLERADKLARLGRYSVLLIGASGTDRSLARPLTRTSAPAPEREGAPRRRVLYLSCYSEKNARITSWVTDPQDPRFGMPETYTINLSAGVEGFKADTLLVHHSHCLHIAEGLLEDDVYGRPVLRRVYNDLIDLQKIKTSSAEAYWQIVAGILQAVIPADMAVNEQDLKELDKQLQELYHDLRRTYYGNAKLERVGGNDPRPKEASDLAIQMIAAGFEVPLRVLIGNETGERASTEDMAAYYGVVAERRVTYAEPMVLRPLIDRFVEIGALPEPASGEYAVVWPALHEESEKEVAEANRVRAEAARALTPVGGNPLDLVEIDPDRNVWLRPTGERGALTADELEGPLPPELPAFEDEDEPAAEEQEA